jgi:ribonuclease R
LSRKTKDLQTYPFPIPEREQMLAVLEEAGVPMSEEELVERLKVAPGEREAVGRRIGAMEREGQIVRNRRGQLLIADKAGLVKGKVIGHPDGFGFLQPDDGSDDLFLGP